MSIENLKKLVDGAKLKRCTAFDNIFFGILKKEYDNYIFINTNGRRINIVYPEMYEIVTEEEYFLKKLELYE